MAVFYIRLMLFCFSMVFTRYKMPAMPLTINLDATSKTATFFATFVLIATFLFINKLELLAYNQYHYQYQDKCFVC